MTRTHLQSAVALVAGTLFGFGLVLSGMTQPTKVIGFLDVFGQWDASLMLVMGGAIAVHFPVYRLIKGRPSPLFAERFTLPTRRDLDAKLLAGAVLFGLGWGLGGFCPGPGVVSLAGGGWAVATFVAAMLVGLFATARVEAALSRRGKAPSQSDTKSFKDLSGAR
jgi:uncharacterized membrane protein YedE/YeeE